MYDNQANDDYEQNIIILKDAYSAIRKWYSDNINLPQELYPDLISDNQKSAELIRSLPDSTKILAFEILAVFEEIKTGILEFGNRHSDGKCEMIEYVEKALNRIRSSSNKEEQLKRSSLCRLIQRLHDDD